ncbi:MAG TPA: ECF-type sigma factor [Bryobacteraceae bacterium]|nr:ECF-type sigma factor [Bryobacteraceae bacterium]
MLPTDPADITSLLTEWREGDEEAGRKLIETVYRELRRLAAMNLRRESSAITLQPTALVNELCLRLLTGPPISCENRLHFLHLASRQMRRLIIDHARRKKGIKRGGSQPQLSLDEARDHVVALDKGIADMNEALTRLEELDSRPAAVVEMRFFGGLTEQEIADVLGISTATVKRDWEFARAWLLTQLRAAPQD